MISDITLKLKEKGLNDTSINKYIRDLILLNNNKEFKNLNFLKNTDKIYKYIDIDEYKITTKRNYYNSINVILLLYAPKFKKLQNIYYNRFVEYNDIIKNLNGKLSDDKQDKYIDYIEILNIYEDLKKKIIKMDFNNAIKLDKYEYNILLEYLTLSLYILQSPRRNKDYLEMYIIKEKSKLLNNNMNYLLIDNAKFIFNNYKTSKIYNQQIIDVNDELLNIIKLYYKFHPLKNSDHDIIPFIVSYKGTHLNNNNSINEILSKINKNLNSTMIRHSFITYTFKDNNIKSRNIASDMGHSQYMQNNYII